MFIRIFLQFQKCISSTLHVICLRYRNSLEFYSTVSQQKTFKQDYMLSDSSDCISI